MPWVSRMDPPSKSPFYPIPAPSSRPDKLWCLLHPLPLATRAGREHHPLTYSKIFRDGREPLWVLSHSIQEFSQPVQSSLDKLTPLPAPRFVFIPTLFWCNPNPASTQAQSKVEREKRSNKRKDNQNSGEGLLKGQRNVYQKGCSKPLL